jgi:lysylphosphatidylglycerol synthetase-like protein (DUF2156 family)
MKSIVKKSLYSAVWVALIAQNKLSMAASIDLWLNKATGVAWSQSTADNAVIKLVWNLATFLSLVAVLFALWGWFNILTAGWAEDKVKKWKTILIQALIWLVVIWLAYSAVSWLVWLVLSGV